MRIGRRTDEPASPIEHARVLRRRIEWLDVRIKQARREKRKAHFDLTERAALQWALDELGKWIDLTDDDVNYFEGKDE